MKATQTASGMTDLTNPAGEQVIDSEQAEQVCIDHQFSLGVSSGTEGFRFGVRASAIETDAERGSALHVLSVGSPSAVLDIEARLTIPGLRMYRGSTFAGKGTKW